MLTFMRKFVLPFLQVDGFPFSFDTKLNASFCFQVARFFFFSRLLMIVMAINTCFHFFPYSFHLCCQSAQFDKHDLTVGCFFRYV